MQRQRARDLRKNSTDAERHIDNHMYDTKRTDWLMTHGYKVLRFWNNDVFQQMPSILEVITSELLKSQ